MFGTWTEHESAGTDGTSAAGDLLDAVVEAGELHGAP